MLSKVANKQWSLERMRDAAALEKSKVTFRQAWSLTIYKTVVDWAQCEKDYPQLKEEGRWLHLLAGLKVRQH